MSHPMIDNPRFRGMTLDEARKLEQESQGFRDLSDREVWALRMVHAHDCTQRPAEPGQGVLTVSIDQRNVWANELRVLAIATTSDAIAKRCDRLADELDALAERPAEPDRYDDEEVRSWAELADEFAGTAEQSLEDSRKQERETGRADLFALGRSEGRSEAAARIRHLIPRLAERPAEPDPEGTGLAADLDEAADDADRMAEQAGRDEQWGDEGTLRSLVATVREAASYIRTLAERPDDPDGGRWFADRVDVYETMPCGCRGDQPSHRCTLAERPAEPAPDPDLVAAMLNVLEDYDTGGFDPPTLARAAAAVAQARIDAAVNADRDRIRVKLFEELDGITSLWARAAIERVIDVVDQETEAAP